MNQRPPQVVINMLYVRNAYSFMLDILDIIMAITILHACILYLRSQNVIIHERLKKIQKPVKPT